jgi:hypothetical protein
LWAEEHIADALVLLKHACDELMDAMPTELFMSRRDLRDVEMDWEKGRSP